MLASAALMLASVPLSTALADLLEARALRWDAVAASTEARADMVDGTRLTTVASVATVVQTVFFLNQGFSSSLDSSTCLERRRRSRDRSRERSREGERDDEDERESLRERSTVRFRLLLRLCCFMAGSSGKRTVGVYRFSADDVGRESDLSASGASEPLRLSGPSDPFRGDSSQAGPRRAACSSLYGGILALVVDVVYLSQG
jgi:hypothetical protein